MKQSAIIIAYLFLAITTAYSQSKDFPTEILEMFESERYEDIINSRENIIDYSESHTDSVSAELLYFLGDSYIAIDKIEEGIKIMELEVQLREKVPSEKQVMIADLLFNLAYYQSLSNQLKSAVANYEKAASIYKNEGSDHLKAYLESVIQQCFNLNSMGSYEKALKLVRSIDKKAKEFFSINFDTYLIKGDALIGLGNYSEATLQIEKAKKLALKEKGKASTYYFKSLVFLGDIKFLTSSYADSELAYMEAIEVGEKIGSVNYGIQISKNNLSILYWRMGLNNEALELITSLDNSSFDQPTNAIRSQNIALIYCDLQQYDSADKYFKRSFSLLSEDSPKKAEFLKNKASDYYLTQSMFDKAIAELELALEIEKNKSNINQPELSKYYFQLGRSYYRKNNIKDAKHNILKAESIRKEVLQSTHPLYADATKELAKLYWTESKRSTAKKYFKLTFNNYFEQISAYFPALSEQQKANFYVNTLRPAFEAYNSFVLTYYKQDPELLSDMLNYQLATKGLIMYSSAQLRENILSKGDDSLLKKYDEWLNTKERIAKVYSLSKEERISHPLDLDSLRSAAELLEKDLNRSSSKFSESNNFAQIKWTDIQSKLKEKETAIEMIRFRGFSPDSSGRFTDKVYYAALMIDKNSDNPELILFDNGSELEQRYIKNYKNAIKYKVKDKYSYEKFWKPIADKTGAYDLIYFSPDGVYNKININSLYNNSSGKYVLEEQNILFLTNSKDLLSLNNTAKKNSKAAQLFGFPNYNKGLSSEDNENQVDLKNIASNANLDRGLRGSLTRYIRGNSLVTMLPGTKEEIQKINELYISTNNTTPKTHLLNEADEAQLKAVKSPSILHIATHGFFLEDIEQEDLNENDKYAQNPLLKSGLILAGANSFIAQGLPEENLQDGILTAYEAINLQLSGTELVVLSACETGLGDLKNGEGVYGLRRAFYLAGARAIIMSLWSVDDAATQDLMSYFYEEWLNGATKLEAFKQAQLKAKEKYKDPFYWGAFVMVGN